MAKCVRRCVWIFPIFILFVWVASLFPWTKKLLDHQQTQVDPDILVVENVSTQKSINIKNLWFFSGGTEFPNRHNRTLGLFPNQLKNDRILEQLMHIPADYNASRAPNKIILSYFETFTQNMFSGCPVNRCSLISEKSKAADVDAIIFKDNFIDYLIRRLPQQIWILYLLECPYYTQRIVKGDVFNWTATYRRDSDLVTPYEKWVYYNPKVRQQRQSKNFAFNKTKKVAWFVSNCNTQNKRLQYAQELSKYISVDIYGACGNLVCERSNNKCFEMLEKDYKFYLAFENTNCYDYITEKFYLNGLGNTVLPIVMGARPQDYEINAPYKSYIHVDNFGNPKELAAYLHRLDKDDDLYNSYFRWKGTGEFINTYFWCRLCAMLHLHPTPRHYKDINSWWYHRGTCTTTSWNNSSFSKRM